MKLLYSILASALFLGTVIAPAEAAPNVSVDFFYDQLGDYGDWLEVGDYGYGWQPRGVGEAWRPYSEGGWAYTEAGWTWISEEPYSWAVYHYGRWAQIEHKGWVWIPGAEWAPAWVSWRRGPQHVGWAPLPPEASFRRDVGFSGWVDSYYDIGPSAYRFVEIRNFGAPRLLSVFIEPRENITIIRQTTNITQITYANNVVNNGGPRYEDISRVSTEPIRRLRLDRRSLVEGDRSSFRGEQMRSQVDGDSLRVFAPGVDAHAAAPPRKLAGKIDKAEVNRGWKDAGPATDVESLRTKVRGEFKVPKGLPPQPKFERLAAQTPAPEAPTPKEIPVVVAPGERPPGEKMKDDRRRKDPRIAPVAPVAEPKTAPAAISAAPEAPIELPKSGKTVETERATAADVPGQPSAPPAQRELPPVQRNKRTLPPEPASRPDAPQPANHKLLPDRPEGAHGDPHAIERTKQKSERPIPPNGVPGNAAPPAPHEGTQKPKSGKGNGKDDKMADGGAPRPQ